MNDLTIPLVGMHFRPPAQKILAALPIGTELKLYPEPGNEYDRNAVRVVMDMTEFPESRRLLLEALLIGSGKTIEDLISEGPFMIGYLAATGGKPARGGPGNVEALMMMSRAEVVAHLGAAPEGYPTVVINFRDSLLGEPISEEEAKRIFDDE